MDRVLTGPEECDDRPMGSSGPVSNPALPAGPASNPAAPYARLAVVGLIQRENNGPEGSLWLLLRRTEQVDVWDPPGGRMEEGEDLAAAVEREVCEETGLSVQVAGPCYSLLTFYKGERLLAVSMACKLLAGCHQVRLEPGEAVDWRWVGAMEWEELAAFGRSSWSVRDIRRAIRMAAILWDTEEEH